jgi:hypothetical protein
MSICRGRLVPAGDDAVARVNAAVGRDDERGPALAGRDHAVRRAYAFQRAHVADASAG